VSFLPGSRTPLEKSNAYILEDMMSSDRSDCSPSSDLFIEDDVPVHPPSKSPSVPESRATITIFSYNIIQPQLLGL
jgi:hypothetical protein